MRYPVRCQIRRDPRQEPPRGDDLGDLAHQGNQQPGVAVGGRPHDRPELPLEDLRPVEADPYRPVAQEGVPFVESGGSQELVPSQVERPDDHGIGRKGLHDMRIGLVLDLLVVGIRREEPQELGPEQADAPRSAVLRSLRLLGELDVRGQLDRAPVACGDRGVRLARESGLGLSVPLAELGVVEDLVGLGIDDHPAVDAVDYDHLPGLDGFGRLPERDHRGYAEAPRQYGRVRGAPAFVRREAENLVLPEAGGHGRIEFPRHYHDRHVELHERLLLGAHELVDDPAADIPDVGRSLAGIRVLHRLESLDDLGQDLADRVFGVQHAFGDPAMDVPLQDRVVHEEDVRVDELAALYQVAQPGGEGEELGARLAEGLLETGLLVLGLGAGGEGEALDAKLFHVEQECRPDGYSRRCRGAFEREAQFNPLRTRTRSVRRALPPHAARRARSP